MERNTSIDQWSARQIWSRHRFIILTLCVTFTVSLLHLWFIRNSPGFSTPIIDASDYVRDARAMLSHTPSTDPYYHSPLYVWFMASVFKLFGEQLLVVRLLQVVMNCFTCLLIYALGCRLFSRAAARLASVIWSLYGPVVFYTSELLNVACILFIYLLALYLVIRASDKPSIVRWLAAGMVSGLAALARPDIVPFSAAVSVAIVLTASRRGVGLTRGFIWAATFMICIAGLLGAVGIRNYQASGRFMVLPANGNLNFYQGNNPGYARTIGIRLESWHTLVDMPLTDGTSSDLNDPGHGSYYFRKTVQFASTYPAVYLGGLLYKSGTLVNSYELPETFDLYTFRKYSPVLRALVWRVGSFGFPFGLLLPLAVWGACVNWARRREIWWLWAITASLILSLVGYFNCSRYRLSIVPILILFASAGLVQLFSRANRDRKKLWAAAVVLLLVGIVSNWPVKHFTQTYDFEAETYGLAGIALANEGRTEEGLASVRHSIELEPESYYSHFMLGRLLVQSGRLDEAVQHFSKALEINPDYYPAYSEMGLALANNGRLDEALQSFSKSLEINQRLCVSHYYVGEIMAAKGRFDDALESFSRALEINPRMYLAYNETGFAWLRKGDLDRAIEFFSKALEIDPTFVVARDNLNGAMAQQRKLRESKPQSPD
jgi:tetratricopeptide (TPR) repeat protein